MTLSVVLASASQVRRRLLEDAGVAMSVDPADVDEAIIKATARREGSLPASTALALADAKARVTSARHPGALVIGADQILECAGDLFDKPQTIDAAAQTLARLRGRRHRLISAVVVVRDGTRRWQYAEAAHLTMRPFSDAFLRWYVDQMGQDLLTSVGAYRLEGLGAQLFSAIEGDFFTILGLPLLPLLEALRREGVLPE
jgi:septum formation protein